MSTGHCWQSLGQISCKEVYGAAWKTLGLLRSPVVYIADLPWNPTTLQPACFEWLACRTKAQLLLWWWPISVCGLCYSFYSCSVSWWQITGDCSKSISRRFLMWHCLCEQLHLASNHSLAYWRLHNDWFLDRMKDGLSYRLPLVCDEVFTCFCCTKGWSWLWNWTKSSFLTPS